MYFMQLKYSLIALNLQPTPTHTSPHTAPILKPLLPKTDKQISNWYSIYYFNSGTMLYSLSRRILQRFQFIELFLSRIK